MMQEVIEYINKDIKYCLGVLRNTKYSGHMQDKYKLQGKLETLREIKRFIQDKL
jgi:hypothetical protein